MAIEVKHKFQSAKADSADASIVRPSNWNDTHSIAIAGQRLLGKATAGQGEAQEITLGFGLSFSGQSLTFNTATALASYSTTAQMGTAINNALSDFSTTAQMNSAINSALNGYATLAGSNVWTSVNRFMSGATFGTVENAGNLGASDGVYIDSGSLSTMRQTRSSTNTRQIQQFYNPNGLVGGITIANSGTTFNTTSDGNFKVNRTVATDAGDIIEALEVVEFDWLHQLTLEPNGDHGIGFIAQDLYQIVPGAVSPGSPDNTNLGTFDYTPWSVDLSKLVPYVVIEIKSLRSRVKTLEATILAMEARLAALE